VLTVVFDVETKKAFDEVGGYFPEKLGVSLAGVWYDEGEDKGQTVVFREDSLGELFKLFEKADTIVGFNSKGFDLPALAPYYPGDLSSLPSVDLLERVERSVGHRVKLDAIAKETLGVQKSGSGLDAINYFRDGRWEELAKYCLKDVEVTRDIYYHGLREGKVKFMDKWNRVVEAEVDFRYSGEGKKTQTTMF